MQGGGKTTVIYNLTVDIELFRRESPRDGIVMTHGTSLWGTAGYIEGERSWLNTQICRATSSRHLCSSARPIGSRLKSAALLHPMPRRLEPARSTVERGGASQSSSERTADAVRTGTRRVLSTCIACLHAHNVEFCVPAVLRAMAAATTPIWIGGKDVMGRGSGVVVAQQPTMNRGPGQTTRMTAPYTPCDDYIATHFYDEAGLGKKVGAIGRASTNDPQGSDLSI